MNSEGLRFSVKRIKDTSFYLNEGLYIPEKINEIIVGFIPTLGFKAEENLIILIIKVVYQYKGEETNPENMLLESQVQNVFEMSSLAGLFNENNILVLPGDFIVALLSLSISHTRALLAKNSAGSPYERIPMPLIDAGEAARFFFPYMFEGDTSQVVVEKVNPQ